MAVVATRRSSTVPKGSGVRTPTGKVSLGKRPTAPGAGTERPPRTPAGQASRKRKIAEKDLPAAVGKGRWSKAVPATVEALHSGKVKDTETAHRHPGSGGKLGPYTAERIDLHAQIARALLQGAGAHPEDAQAVFLAGGPASGKSTLLKQGHVKVPADAVDVNPDIVKTMLPEYQALVAKGDKQASSKVHEESSHIAKMVMNLSLARHHHVVVDGVGNSGKGKFAGKMMEAHNAGHAVSVHYATIPTDDAVARAEKRGARTGRNVPEGYLRASHRDVSSRFVDDVQHLQHVAVNVYDTTSKRVKKTFEKAAGAKAGQVRNQKLHDAFVRKAAEQVHK